MAAFLSHGTGLAGQGDITQGWRYPGTRTEQTSKEAAPARPPREETEETGKEEERNMRENSSSDGYAASRALARIPTTQGEQLSFRAFSPNLHNSLLFCGAAEQGLPFSSAPWGSFSDPNFHP